MRVICTQKLLDKYPGNDVKGLLGKLASSVDILPSNDYLTIKQHCDTINEEILLIGNHDTLQFCSLPNPTQDNDSSVLSDAPYACIQDNRYLIPDKVIARLPDEYINANFDFLQTVINNQVGYMTAKSPNQGWFNVVASVWTGIAQYMQQALNMNADPLPSPPTVVNTITIQQTTVKYTYFNSHGTQGNGLFYGQSGNIFPVLLQPTSGNFKGCIAFFEACYGGFLIGRDRNSSIPLQALLSGAAATVASTCTAYGPASPPAQGCDLLCENFFKRVFQGEPLGKAFLDAKKSYATNILQQFGGLTGPNAKTLLQFHLFGNPLIIGN